ncbi:ATP-binding protein [Streptomyces sp. NPDC046821]|uniref:ATP-binding protein n=1 Tax=Streptomyces sp. NPDC046821 TaxID=3154702 RepID=UPI0033DF9BC9
MDAFSSDGLEALLSAMAVRDADHESPAWHGLARVMDAAARADPSVTRFWPLPAVGRGPAATALLRELTLVLQALAERDAATRRALTEWLRHHTASAEASPGTATNVISGGSVLHGPSVQARDVHGGIHFHSPSPPSAIRPDVPVPRQLPPVTARFIGREADRQALNALRAQHPAHAPQVLVVSGLAGIGKTTLAIRWLHEHADSFPDGQLYADLGGQSAAPDGPTSTAVVLEAFLVALGASSVPNGIAQRSALWRSMTSGLRLAVLLDSAFTAAQVRPLLLGTPTGLTLVTSRNNLTGLHVDGASIHR